MAVWIVRGEKREHASKRMEDEHAMDRSAGDAYGEGKWSCARARTYPEVAGELGAEAVEEGLPVEPRVGLAYIGALRGRPPAEDLDQRPLVRAPPCSEPASAAGRSSIRG